MVLIVLIVVVREEFPWRIGYLHAIKHTGGREKAVKSKLSTEETHRLHIMTPQTIYNGMEKMLLTLGKVWDPH